GDRRLLQRAGEAEVAVDAAFDVGHFAAEQLDEGKVVEAQVELATQRLLRAADRDLAIQTAAVVESAVHVDALSCGSELGIQAQLVITQQWRVGTIGVGDAALRRAD